MLRPTRGSRYPTPFRIDELEPRRLLTITVSGTPGPDDIDMQLVSGVTKIHVNGDLVSASTGEINFLINGLDGDDHIVVSQTASTSHTTVNGARGKISSKSVTPNSSTSAET